MSFTPNVLHHATVQVMVQGQILATVLRTSYSLERFSLTSAFARLRRDKPTLSPRRGRIIRRWFETAEDHFRSWSPCRARRRLRRKTFGFFRRWLASRRLNRFLTVAALFQAAQFGDKYSQFGVVGGAGRALLSVESKIIVQRFFFA